jgi:dTDP-4-dehydrorhamnose reductase
VWITGAAGLLGANLTLEFLDHGLPVLPITRSHGFRVSGVCSIPCELTEPRSVAELFSQKPPSLIVHCAAATNVDWCETHPDEAMHINAESAGHLAARAEACGAPFVFISTDAVFDGLSGGYSESDQPNPLNVYARTKLAGEQAVLRANPEALILRVNTYGWNLQPKFSLAEWFLYRLEQRESAPGFRDVSFAPILANDLASCILSLVKLASTGIFNAGSSDHMSKFDFARQISEVFALDPSLLFESSVAESSLAAPRPRNLWLRTDKLAAALGHPLPTIRQGLERFKALRDNGFTQRLKAAASTTSRSAVACQR